MDIRRFSDESLLYAALAEYIHDTLSSVFGEYEQPVIALPGGRTPEHYLPGVFKRKLPWHRLAVVPTDERWVPVDDAQSNERLLKNLIAPSCRLLSLHTDDATPEAALPRVEQDLSTALAGDPLNLAVVGMGADGHVASLFPEAPVKMSPEGMICASRPQGLPPRISLSLQTLVQARHVCLVVSGQNKAALLSRVVAEGSQLPVGRLLAHTACFVKVFVA